MSTITTPGAKPGLKRYNIRICTGGTTAMQTAIARNSAQAWNIAFGLCERLLGDTPPRSVSVKPVGTAYGLRGLAA
jgi:iron-sulfur cluster repair protein YtfE (RIC family)